MDVLGRPGSGGGALIAGQRRRCSHGGGGGAGPAGGGRDAGPAAGTRGTGPSGGGTGPHGGTRVAGPVEPLGLPVAAAMELLGWPPEVESLGWLMVAKALSWLAEAELLARPPKAAAEMLGQPLATETEALGQLAAAPLVWLMAAALGRPMVEALGHLVLPLGQLLAQRRPIAYEVQDEAGQVRHCHLAQLRRRWPAQRETLHCTPVPDELLQHTPYLVPCLGDLPSQCTVGAWEMHPSEDLRLPPPAWEEDEPREEPLPIRTAEPISPPSSVTPACCRELLPAWGTGTSSPQVEPAPYHADSVPMQDFTGADKPPGHWDY
ncbi:UNVERIFIED_CONTAM: hypothetical protein K2H54_057299 [Gekko kuhli]